MDLSALQSLRQNSFQSAGSCTRKRRRPELLKFLEGDAHFVGTMFWDDQPWERVVSE